MLALLCFSQGGCSGDPRAYEDHSRDAMRYAVTLKQMVYEVVNEAIRAPDPGDIIWPLVLELEQKDRPRGDFAQVVDELHQEASQLHASCQQAPSGRPADLESRLRRLLALAEKLPGEPVAAFRPFDD